MSTFAALVSTGQHSFPICNDIGYANNFRIWLRKRQYESVKEGNLSFSLRLTIRIFELQQVNTHVKVFLCRAHTKPYAK